MAKKRNLDLFKKVIPAIDRKDYNFYDTLSDVEKKEFAPMVLMRWGVNINYNNAELLGYYVRSTNHYTNKHLFALHKHPKLQWMMIVASSPKMGNYKRQWIGKKKKPMTKTQKDILAMLRKRYPTYKDEDILLLSTMYTRKDLKQYAKDCGKE